MTRHSKPLLPTATIAAAVLAVLASAQAQAQISTPEQFVQACRTAPAHTVVLTQQTKFQTGSANTTFSTPTGCNVVLGTGASLELDTITLRFGGAFTVKGAANTKVQIDKATLSAPSIAIAFNGTEGQFQMNTARMDATAGNLSISFGALGKMEIKDSGVHYQPRLTARGTLNLTTGANFSGVIVNSGLQGALGVNIALNGFDAGLKMEQVDILVSSGALGGLPYLTGPFQVSSSANKVSFQAINVSLMEASQAVSIALNGAESKLGLSNVTSQTSSKRISITAMGEKGEVKVERALMYGLPEVVIESGTMGSTSVTNSPGTITASQLIRVRAGLGGSCSATTQGMNAPVLKICR